jgi:hypothetical protein
MTSLASVHYACTLIKKFAIFAVAALNLGCGPLVAPVAGVLLVRCGHVPLRWHPNQLQLGPEAPAGKPLLGQVC